MRFFTRLCNVTRSKGTWKKLRKAVAKLPPSFSAEEKGRLDSILKLAFTKPMKGRWGSFNDPRQKVLDIANATHDRHMMARLLNLALDTLLAAAYRKQAEDDQPQPIQEEDDVSRNLRVRARYAVYDAKCDSFYVDLNISHVSAIEQERQLWWLEKVRYDDGTRVTHVRDLAAGKSLDWVNGTLKLLDMNREEWTGLHKFVGTEGPNSVSMEHVHTKVVEHIMITVMEQWRRFVIPYRGAPFFLVELLDAPEDYDEPSERRRECALKMLNHCWVCLGRGSENLREMFYDEFERIALDGGRIRETFANFWKDFFNEFPYETQDIEGKNSKIKRRQWLARAMTFGRMARKMNISESSPISEAEFIKVRPQAIEMTKENSWPFTPDRFDAVQPRVIQRLPKFPCEHNNVECFAQKEAELIADFIDVNWQLCWVLRIGK